MSDLDDYRQAMEFGQHEYADVLALLEERGYRAEFAQTGGMCAAIKLDLNPDRFALIVDCDGPLSWERSDHQGWTVAIYDVADTSEEIALESTDDGSLEALAPLLPPTTD
ncbi:hypothetical protein HCA61_03715 [Rhodococcus sp. HNM0563]|uniref:hypothetical protein n=1 Tax=Rhodococcus sp. HNM0563 TaxID=2716339 RepID=UPI00146E6884|nr:hypothetical protein [Rhodococcus sp. HNM0563]NLU61369.1 hypothetical protein [Rhodococcus sp. HNM0563]